MTQKTNTVSGKYADATQHNLFKPNNFEHGVDLLSINLAVSLSDILSDIVPDIVSDIVPDIVPDIIPGIVPDIIPDIVPEIIPTGNRSLAWARTWCWYI